MAEVAKNLTEEINNKEGFSVVDTVDSVAEVTTSENKALKIVGGVVMVAGLATVAYLGIKKFIGSKKMVAEVEETANDEENTVVVENSEES